MSVQTMYRLANTSEEEAISGLKRKYPTAEILSFSKKGDQYIAEFKLPEDDEAGDDAPPSDNDDSDDGSDEGPEGLDLGGDKEKAEPASENKKEDEILGLLHKIMKHLHIDEHDEEEGPDLAGGDLPDIGAPPAGEPMPPKLPTPAPNPKGMHPGGPAFASHMAKVEGTHTFIAHRKQASELGNRGLIAEAHSGFPGYQVVKLDRLTHANQDIATLTLQKKNR